MDPLDWTLEQCEAWIARDAADRLDDLYAAQQRATSIQPSFRNRRVWLNAAKGYTRLVQLELRAAARNTAKICSEAATAQRLDSEMRDWLSMRGGPPYIEEVIGGLFDHIEDAFAGHHWRNVDSIIQAMRLLFVLKRTEAFIVGAIATDGLTKDFVPSVNRFLERQLELAFNTPEADPLPQT